MLRAWRIEQENILFTQPALRTKPGARHVNRSTITEQGYQQTPLVIVPILKASPALSAGLFAAYR
jgi:hypothetical protein